MLNLLMYLTFLLNFLPQMLTHLRFASTVLVGLLIGAIYHDAGNDASKVFNNAGNLFFGLLFMVFSSMMSTVLTCKSPCQSTKYFDRHFLIHLNFVVKVIFLNFLQFHWSAVCLFGSI